MLDRLGAWQSGAFGYYADGRLQVVNLDGVVDPEAADAYRDGTTLAYMRERGVDWLADFSLHIVWFAVHSKEQLHPPATIAVVKGLPQFPPFPEYALGQITWP